MVAEADGTPRAAGSRHTLTRPGLPSIAYDVMPGDPAAPGLFFLSGYGSSGLMGEKATYLAAFARERSLALLRFDYSGHGVSEGDRAGGTIGRWRDEALALFDQKTAGPQILIGSSMGGWLALLLARARPGRIAGLVLIAPAVDFIERLAWESLADADRERVMRGETVTLASPYLADGVLLTRAILEDGRQNAVLAGSLALGVPLRILQGMEDNVVPWRQALDLVSAIDGRDVRLTLVKDGDHRLSRPADLAILGRELAALMR